MMQKESLSFISNPDFELRFSQNRLCEYDIYHSGFKEGLVVYIPGFGDDLGAYTEVFCRKVAAEYQLATMSVAYFCLNSRPAAGAEIEFEEFDLQDFSAMIPESEGVNYLQTVMAYAEAHRKHFDLNASLKPKRGEYQNFGVLAALDILNAIKDAVDKYALNPNNIILIGSSYGGYLANLVTKLFPGYIRAVFDNSSWAIPKPAYVVGREIKQAESKVAISDWVTLHLYVKSPWTLVGGLPNSFDENRILIRSFFTEQTAQMAAQGGVNTFYFFYHSSLDELVPAEEKIEMVQSMLTHGFKHVHIKIAEESDIDGVLIKNLAHSMGMSMLTFFNLAYAALNKANTQFIANDANIFSYQLATCAYKFDVRQSPIAAFIEYYH